MLRLPTSPKVGEFPHKIMRKMFVSLGVAMRTKTWTGYGKNVPNLGYSDEVLPNVESPEFVSALTAENENEEAE